MWARKCIHALRTTKNGSIELEIKIWFNDHAQCNRFPLYSIYANRWHTKSRSQLTAILSFYRYLCSTNEKCKWKHAKFKYALLVRDVQCIWFCHLKNVELTLSRVYEEREHQMSKCCRIKMGKNSNKNIEKNNNNISVMRLWCSKSIQTM